MSDIIMVTKYHAEGRQRFATASIICITLCLMWQSLMVYGQNAKKSRGGQIQEQLILFSLLKPGVDAWRCATFVVSNREEDTTIDPRTELTVARCIELAFESIPGTVLQLAALVHAEEVDNVAYFALLSSIVTAGSISAYMSWDWDMDKEMREGESSFYGYIPKMSLARKALIAASLFVGSICCLLERSLICVCLAQKGLCVVAAVLSSEMLIFFAAKVFAGDFMYWLPMHGLLGYIAAFAGRLITKVLVDWTFFVQARNPTEVGGTGFGWSLVSTVAIGLASATTMDEIQGPFEKATLMKIMIGVCIGLLVSFAVLLCSIDQNYLDTFISTKTGSVYIQENFTKKEEDEKKFTLFENNEHKWKPVIGDDVKAWVGEHLQQWIDEKPVWFTNYRKSTIPDWCVDDKTLLKKLRAKEVNEIRSKRRFSSFIGAQGP